MIRARSQFIGAAGLFHIAREMALRGINAALTVGNAPSVDLTASSHDGLKTLSFQVKTSWNAYRSKRYGHEGYEWDVNRAVINKHSATLWYAFVNLRENNKELQPEIFFVPSRWVAEFVKSDWSRFMYFLPSTAKELCYENWNIVQDYLATDAKANKRAIEWATSWPEQRLVKWGKIESTNIDPTTDSDTVRADC